jgi:hypothetical protein
MCAPERLGGEAVAMALAQSGRRVYSWSPTR